MITLDVDDDATTTVGRMLVLLIFEAICLDLFICSRLIKQAN
jgi:hypothetical protein